MKTINAVNPPGTGFSSEKDKKTANVKWNIKSVINQETKAETTGDWNFTLKLKAADSMTQKIDRSTEHDGVVIHLDKISITPMSFIIYYDQVVDQKVKDQWDAIDAGIKVKDDLGHVYTGQGNGGTGDKEGYNMIWSKTFEKLDPNATKLIITPLLSLYNRTSDNHGSVEMTRDGLEKGTRVLQEKTNDKEEYVLKDIIIDLKH